MSMKVPAGLCHGCLQPVAAGSRAKWCDRCRPPGKYGAVATGGPDGVRVASRKEARRHAELLLLLQAGRITELQAQVRYPLLVNGVRIGAYVADFVYREDGQLVVEDAKGYRTRVYRIKAKLMLALYGIAIREV